MPPLFRVHNDFARVVCLTLRSAALFRPAHLDYALPELAASQNSSCNLGDIMRADLLRASVLFVLFAAVIAPRYALANTIDFSGAGIVGPRCSDPNPFGCLGVAPGENIYRFGSETDWQLDSLFAFDFMPAPGTPNGLGTFRFFSTGGDEISGSLATFLFPPPNPGLPPFIELQYTVTGGLGRFAGATGTGSSNVLLLFDPTASPRGPYCEGGPFCDGAGQFTLTVPEPGTLSLFLLGLALGGIVRHRAAKRHAG